MPAPASTLPDGSRNALRLALEHELLADIPLSRAMALRITAWDGEVLEMNAPLAPNINDKGCAFGGSLASVMTLAGWALVRLAVDAAGLASDIYVQDSTIRYLAPVWGDLHAQARLDGEDSFATFLDALRARGKARLTVQVVVAADDGSPATTLSARFVAMARADSSKRSVDAAQSPAIHAA
jgi:thioesterase domain-containing protein